MYYVIPTVHDVSLPAHLGETDKIIQTSTQQSGLLAHKHVIVFSETSSDSSEEE